MKKFTGFTLAEVLITLGVIGVVAAITMPVLIKNYQKTVWVNQLKKSVSIIEQGFQKMMADEGVDRLSDTEFWGLIEQNEIEYACNNEDLTEYNNILKKYFNVLQFYDYSYDTYCPLGDTKNGLYKNLSEEKNELFDGDVRKIWLADGTLIGLWAHSIDDQQQVAAIAIDINGEEKGPNCWGRDAFAFRLVNTGILVTENKDTWERYNDCGNDRNSSNITDSYGFGCAARIMQNGWKMDY